LGSQTANAATLPTSQISISGWNSPVFAAFDGSKIAEEITHRDSAAGMPADT
jgi:hypothetical protein